MSGVPCFQILYPLGHENLAIWSTITGAVINLVICLMLIPMYSYNSAAIATVVGETTVTITMFLYGHKFINVKFFSVHYLNCIIGSFLMFVCIMPIRIINLGNWMTILIIPVVGSIVYCFYLYVRKDNFCMYVLELIINKIKR